MEVECAGRLSLRQVSPTRPSPAASPVTEWSLWTLTGPWSREWRSSMVWCPWSRQDGPEASPDLGCSLGGGTVTSLTLYLPSRQGSCPQGACHLDFLSSPLCEGKSWVLVCVLCKDTCP